LWEKFYKAEFRSVYEPPLKTVMCQVSFKEAFFSN